MDLFFHSSERQKSKIQQGHASARSSQNLLFLFVSGGCWESKVWWLILCVKFMQPQCPDLVKDYSGCFSEGVRDEIHTEMGGLWVKHIAFRNASGPQLIKLKDWTELPLSKRKVFFQTSWYRFCLVPQPAAFGLKLQLLPGSPACSLSHKVLDSPGFHSNIRQFLKK